MDKDCEMKTRLRRAVWRIASGRYAVLFRPDGAPPSNKFRQIVSPVSDFPGVYALDVGDGCIPCVDGETVVFRAKGVNFRCIEFDCWADVYDMRIIFNGISAPVLFASDPERVKEKYSFYLQKAMGWDPNRAAGGRLWLDVQLACAGFAAEAPSSPSL